MVSPIDAAMHYAVRQGWAVFPCCETAARRKKPYIEHGFKEASRDPGVSTRWWQRRSESLIDTPTGEAFVVLDLDIKRGDANGYDSLDELGQAILPNTWLAHTASGGLHVYFDPDGCDIRNSAGKLAPGLDVRGVGGYIILPSPGSGYAWDPHWNPDTSALAPAPDWLTGELEQQAKTTPRPIIRQPLSPYAEAALDSAVEHIIKAVKGAQRDTLNREVFAIAGLVAGGSISSPLALEALYWAARQMVTHDPRRPWLPRDLDRLVDAAFIEGLQHPRRPHGGRPR